MRPLLTALIALATVAYPLLVYTGMSTLEPRWMALLLAALALARAAAARSRTWLAAAAGATVLAAFAWAGNAWLPLKLYPALVNTLLLVVFGASLRWGPPVVERLARLHEPELPPAGVAYTRRVTQAWCGFFVVNGGIALATALWASDAVWAFYNGLLAYLLIGLFFGAEWLLRRRLRARLAAGSVHV
ncbi:hypothetical protein CKO43_00100 [Rubrivivax gelatinosus]|uniref:DNA gyrase subunit B n=1 Tax=Rubrivivax gelatinosus TaxID=28068 RepID=A0ABS1DPU0_RUBGE|nr:hypothetical protein [Rubrivivax gelatinosus]MBK1711181.1 hypothetical protein [Rubrivivax gelatinosus]